MGKKYFYGFAIAVLAGVFNAYAAEPTVELEARQWNSKFSSKAKVVRFNIGRTFDLDKDLGVGDEEISEGVLTFHTGKQSKIRLSYYDVEFEGSESLTQTIEFQGFSYNVGTTVNSSVDIQYARLGWLYYFGEATDSFRVGTIVEAKAIDFDIALEVPALPSQNQDESAIGGLLTLGLAFEFRPVDKLLVYGEAAGMSGGSHGRFVEAEGGLKYELFDYMSVSAGYRMIDFKLKDDPDFLEMKLEGYFFGAGLQF